MLEMGTRFNVQDDPAPRLNDPALEPSDGGHTLLQRRFSLFGKVLVLQSIAYWLIYALIWVPTKVRTVAIDAAARTVIDDAGSTLPTGLDRNR